MEAKKSFFLACETSEDIGVLRNLVERNPEIVQRRAENWQHAIYGKYARFDEALNIVEDEQDEDTEYEEYDDPRDDESRDLARIKYGKVSLLDPVNSCVICNRPEVLTMLLRDFHSDIADVAVRNCIVLRNRRLLSVLLDYIDFHSLRILLIQIVMLDELELLDIVMEKGLLNCETLQNANLFCIAYEFTYVPSKIALRLAQYLQENNFLCCIDMENPIKRATNHADYEILSYYAQNIGWTRPQQFQPDSMAGGYDKGLLSYFHELHHPKSVDILLDRLYPIHTPMETSLWVRDMYNHKVILDYYLRFDDVCEIELENVKEHLFKRLVEYNPWSLCVFNRPSNLAMMRGNLYQGTLVDRLLFYKEYDLLIIVREVLQKLIEQRRPFDNFPEPSVEDSDLVKTLIVVDPAYLLRQIDESPEIIFLQELKDAKSKDDIENSFCKLVLFLRRETLLYPFPFRLDEYCDNCYYLEEYLRWNRNGDLFMRSVNITKGHIPWSETSFISSFSTYCDLEIKFTEAMFAVVIDKSSPTLYLTMLGLYCSTYLKDFEDLTYSLLSSHMQHAVKTNNETMMRLIPAQLPILIQYYQSKHNCTIEVAEGALESWRSADLSCIFDTAAKNLCNFEVFDYLWTLFDHLISPATVNEDNERLVRDRISLNRGTKFHDILVQLHDKSPSLSSKFKEAREWCTRYWKKYRSLQPFCGRKTTLGAATNCIISNICVCKVSGGRLTDSEELKMAQVLQRCIHLAELSFQQCDAIANEGTKKEDISVERPAKRPRQGNPLQSLSHIWDNDLHKYVQFDGFNYRSGLKFYFAHHYHHIIDVLHSRMLLFQKSFFPSRLFDPGCTSNLSISIEMEKSGAYPGSDKDHLSLWSIMHALYKFNNLYALDLLVTEAFLCGGARTVLFLLGVRCPHLAAEDGLFICRRDGYSEMEEYILQKRHTMVQVWTAFESMT